MTIEPALFSKASDEWATPQDLFDRLNAKFGFTLDACATPANAKCARFFVREDDGLLQDWAGETVFVNPPYSNVKAWVRKAYQESQKPGTIVVCLLPSRTDTRFWWDYVMQVWPHGIRFLRGRLKFGGAKKGAPFPSCIVIFGEAVRQ